MGKIIPQIFLLVALLSGPVLAAEVCVTLDTREQGILDRGAQADSTTVQDAAKRILLKGIAVYQHRLEHEELAAVERAYQALDIADPVRAQVKALLKVQLPPPLSPEGTR